MVSALLARLWPFSTADSEENGSNAPEEDGSDAPEEDGSDAPEENGSNAPGENDGQTRSWDIIPNWQYTGRHVETGGMTVDEQERALEEIQTQAEAIEGAESDVPHDPDARSG